MMDTKRTPLHMMTNGTWPSGLLRLGGFALPLILVAATIAQPFIDPKWLYFDTVTAAEFSDNCCKVYYGAMSTLGIMLWTMNAATCLFVAWMLLMTGLSRPLMRFALWAGLLGGWMALDDAFLIHENVMPAFGIPQNGVLMVYAILGLGYAWSARTYLNTANSLFFYAAAIGFAVSLGVDVLLHSVESLAIVIEDGAKFIAIWCWLLFNLCTLTNGLMFGHEDRDEEQTRTPATPVPSTEDRSMVSG